MCIRWLIPFLVTLSAYAASNPVESLKTNIDNLFSAFDAPGAPGASVMVVQDGQPLLAWGYGLANLEPKLPCGTNTNFRLASVTKQFTAMAILILRDRKLLALDERLPDFFPEFPACGSNITVRHLLTHTSGLIDYEDVIPKGTEIPVLDRDVLRLLMQQHKTYFPPGSRFRYSNTAYALLALMVELRSGNTFARFLRENIFQPLGMAQTLAYESGLSAVPHRAYGYSHDHQGWKLTDQSLTSSVLGDGGIYSSVADLCRWDAALYTDTLVSSNTLAEAFTPGPSADHPRTGYGLGWFVGEYRGLREIWHSGNSLGFTTRIARFPERRFTVIILTNRNEAQIAEYPHRIADWCLFAGQ